ncbi:AAA family ATPase, partial [Methanophagales archaeon]
MPLIAITGTPGTGKTSVCRALGSEEYNIINLNTVIKRRGFYTGIDADRGCLIADLRRLAEYIRREVENSEKPVVIESHLAHLLPLQPDVAIVLRANPAVLASRLRQ